MTFDELKTAPAYLRTAEEQASYDSVFATHLRELELDGRTIIPVGFKNQFYCYCVQHWDYAGDLDIDWLRVEKSKEQLVYNVWLA